MNTNKLGKIMSAAYVLKRHDFLNIFMTDSCFAITLINLTLA